MSDCGPCAGRDRLTIGGAQVTQLLTKPRGADSTELRGAVSRSAQLGIDLCRRGDWKRGLAQLSVIEANKGGGQAIPGLALTYLGYGIAKHHGRLLDGLRYCKAGVDREIWRAENHFNLARTYLIGGQVKRAIAALDYGLGLEPTHPAMLELRMSLGVRRSPTFPFLDRGHLLNRLAGKLRHNMAGRAFPRAAAPAASASERS
jgi:hypothetical protein